MSSLWNSRSCAYTFPQHPQAMVTKSSRFNFSSGTSRASLSQCRDKCHWCPAYIVFKGLLFIVALRKSLIRLSEGRKTRSPCKNLIKGCLYGSFSKLFLTDLTKRHSSKDKAHLKGAVRPVLHLSEQATCHLFSLVKNITFFIFHGVRLPQ